MTGQRYIDEVLLPHVRLFRGAVGDKFVFMDDNATCLRTLADALGRQVAGRNYPPTNKNTLIRALTEEWDKLPQQLLDNVVQSMLRDRLSFTSSIVLFISSSAPLKYCGILSSDITPTSDGQAKINSGIFSCELNQK
ncbi:hypothetical protein TNCV_4837301 [Trichonephila clavipes]|nr:hypothetical protein TNCV_4837301 [Trichonephila clavipes]